MLQARILLAAPSQRAFCVRSRSYALTHILLEALETLGRAFPLVLGRSGSLLRDIWGSIFVRFCSFCRSPMRSCCRTFFRLFFHRFFLFFRSKAPRLVDRSARRFGRSCRDERFCETLTKHWPCAERSMLGMSRLRVA